MPETSLHFSTLLFWKSPFPLISAHFPPRWVACQGIVECHHIPGWHSCLDIAEVQALARAACREETATGSQGLSAHLLPEPVREPSFITSTDAKSSSCHSGDILSCDLHSVRFPSQVCMFGFGVVQLKVFFSPAFCLIHLTCSSSQIIFQKARHLETASHSIPLLYLISVILLCWARRLRAGRGRFNRAASFSSRTPTLKKRTL